jgi:hypothetical protein
METTTLTKRPSTFEDPDKFPALSLWQPYGGLVWLAGAGFPGKEIETRGTPISYRGPLVFCVGHHVDKVALHFARIRLVDSGLVQASVFDKACGPSMAGKAVAMFEVMNSRPLEAKDHPLAFTDLGHGIPLTQGRYAYDGGTIAALDPFVLLGRQGYFRAPKEQVIAAIRMRTDASYRLEKREARARMAKALGRQVTSEKVVHYGR